MDLPFDSVKFEYLILEEKSIGIEPVYHLFILQNKNIQNE